MARPTHLPNFSPLATTWTQGFWKVKGHIAHGWFTCPTHSLSLHSAWNVAPVWCGLYKTYIVVSIPAVPQVWLYLNTCHNFQSQRKLRDHVSIAIIACYEVVAWVPSQYWYYATGLKDEKVLNSGHAFHSEFSSTIDESFFFWVCIVYNVRSSVASFVASVTAGNTCHQ